MNKTKSYLNWHMVTDKDDIIWLTFSCVDSSVNKFTQKVLEELSTILLDINQLAQVNGLIITSDKASGFSVGADLEQFKKIQTSEQAMSLVHLGQNVFNQLANLKVPTVAVIDGFCLGGGCELILACQYRVANEDLKTRIGLPEVLLGVHPGWGGSVRLPSLIGAPQAMDLMLSGRTINAKDAARMGVVDMAVPKRHLERAAQYFVLSRPKKHQPTILQAITNHTLLRSLLAKIFQHKVLQKASPNHYPAPYAIIDNWKRIGVENKQQALKIEAESFGKLAVTETSHNLVRVYFLQDHLKALDKNVEFNAQHVHVIGAGTMGGDIAAWCALRGFKVTLQDREPRYIAPAIKRAYELVKKKLKSNRLVQEVMDRLVPDANGLGIARADVIIEAIYENLDAKQKLFREIELLCKPEALLATNTSSIPLDEINTVLQKPERLVGIHFFNPVAMMQLVEVVQGKVTATEVIKNAIHFVRRIDRLPLPVKSSPGFLVNRVLMPYLMEAMILMDEGIPATLIDEAAVNFGMPMGPVQLADSVGLDVCLAVAENLSRFFAERVPEKLLHKVTNKEFGRKTNKGFYSYKNGKVIKEKIKSERTIPDLVERLIFRMINEAVACLQEDVVANSDLVDAGMIFGTGFAPFRGGPMHYAEEIGLGYVYEQLQHFAVQYGDRFKPHKGWTTIISKIAKSKPVNHVEV